MDTTTNPGHGRTTARSATLASAMAALLLAAALPAQAAGAEVEIASCVPGTPPLRATAQAERALLDPVDRARFQVAAVARYPQYERGGQGPHHVLILHHDDQWLYVTLQRPEPGAPCFTAVFDAEQFGFTPAWLVKYRPQAGAGDD